MLPLKLSEMFFTKTLPITFCIILSINQVLGCIPRNYPDGTVCVCDSYNCDSIPSVGEIAENSIKILYTSATNAGINVKSSTFGTQPDPTVVAVTVNDIQHQKIVGFGGGITDSASSNIMGISEELRAKLLEAYFGDDGIEYNTCRVPLGSCDFSPRYYSMDDHENDVNLDYFALQDEDINFKIPVLQQAQQLRGEKQFNLIATAWSAPTWMKNNPVWHGGCWLLPEYFQTWADYHVKFFDEYLKRGVKFWGMTIGNEPLLGFMTTTTIPSMGWTTTDQETYIKENLGPTLRDSQYQKDIKVLIHDTTAPSLPFLVPPLLLDADALEYIDGIAMHWYEDNNFLPDQRLIAHTDQKDLFVLNTEACHFNTRPILGSWQRAADYIDNIMTNLQWGYNGWLEWNIALDSNGGPSLINIFADAPIIISEDKQEFYKQPTFYVIGHFSKYIIPDSVRLGTVTTGNVNIVAFLRPDGIKVVTVYNWANQPTTIQIADGSKFSAPIELPALSLNTMLYNN